MSRVENDNNDNDNNNNNTLRFVAKRESSSVLSLLKNSFQNSFYIRIRTQRETHKKRSSFVLSSSSFQQHFIPPNKNRSKK